MNRSTTKTKIAVIVAGGAGLRMGATKPKQFLELEGRPILVRTIETFLSSYPDMQVILVLPPAYMEEGKLHLSALSGKERISYVSGGETRFHSVQNGLERIRDSSIVFVHDAVRCLLSVELIHRCYNQAIDQGSAIPTIPSADSIRLVEGSTSRSVSRNSIRLVQTPQTFQSEILLPAYQTEYRTDFTDEASVVEFSGVSVHLVEGEPQNIKITTPLDLLLAAEYLRAHSKPI